MKSCFSIESESWLKLLFWINSVLVFWYFSNSILGNKALATSPLLLLSLITFYSVIREFNGFWNSHKWWILGLFLFGAFNIAHLIWRGVDISDDYDKPAKALAALLVFLYLLRFGFSDKIIGIAIVIATLVGSGYTFYEKCVLDFSRAGEVTNPIRYGYIMTTLGLLCFFYAIYSDNRWMRYGFGVAGFFGMIGAYNTGTRGVVLILFFLLVYFSCVLVRERKISWVVLVGAILGISAILFFLGSNTKFLDSYYDKTVHEINRIEKGHLNTSIGLRLQMWHVAAYLGVKEPVTGAGDDYSVLKEKAGEFIKENKYNPAIMERYRHFHNQYLDLFAKQGIPGVVVWILFLLGAVSGMKSHYRYAVIMIVATLAIGGLTEAVLRSSRLYYLAVLGVSVFRCLDYFEINKRISRDGVRTKSG